MKLWHFCECFYGRKPIETLCLQLQNSHGAHVGLIIWLCWHAAQERFLTTVTFDAAKKYALGPQQSLIESLRSVRKSPSLKALEGCEVIAGHVLTAEILLEKVILERLEADFLALPLEALQPKMSDGVFGLLDYLVACHVPDANQVAKFLYKNASACIT